MRTQGSRNPSKSFSASPLRRRIKKRRAGRSEIVDRLRDRCQIGPQRRHPVEVIEADDRHVAGDFEANNTRRLDRGESAHVGEGENRGRPIGAVEFKLDRSAQAFKVMAPVDDAIPPVKPCLDESPAGAGDAALDIVEPLRMGENRDVAVSEVDEAARRRIAAGEAIGADGVESGAPAPRSINTAGGRRDLSAPSLRAAIESSLPARQ